MATGGDLIYLCPDPLDPQCGGLRHYFGEWTTGKPRSVLLAASRELYQQMSVYFDAGIRLRIALKKRTEWDLVIADDRGRKRKDIELLYPHRLPPCDGATVMAPSAPD